ncbi:MAG: IgGFc-binding protein [Flavobacteriaceae bacterium]|nr:IgGFc-binding protein [Flavobacteriaceae bacterium]
MKQLKTILLIFLISLFGGGGTYAQLPGTPYIVPTYYAEENLCTGFNTLGRDFWVTFGHNYTYTAANVFFALNIAANLDTDVTLTFKETGQVAQYHITGGTVHQIDLSKVQGNVPPNNTNLGDMRASVYLYTAGTLPVSSISGRNNKSLHIESTMPVSVYAFNTGTTSTDATILIPTQTWGRDYYRLSYQPYHIAGQSGGDNRDIELIIAKEDDTELFLDGAITPFAVIDAGEVYYLYGGQDIDLTGRHITSGKPVGYFTHSQLVFIPKGLRAGDILLEQLSPVNQWGTKFLVPNVPEEVLNNTNILTDELNHIRILASQDNTTVTYFGATLRTTDFNNQDISGDTPILSGQTLDRGQWVELEIDGDRTTDHLSSCYITTNKPVGVTAYLIGSGGDGLPSVIQQVGDPSISRIPSIEQSLTNVLIAPFMFQPGVNNPYTVLDGIAPSSPGPVNPIVTHYAIIITPTASKGSASMTSNGSPVVLDPNQWVDNIASTEGGTQPGFSYYIHTFDNVNDYGKSFIVSNSDEGAGVIVLAAGMSRWESYYYNAGSGACVINP